MNLITICPITLQAVSEAGTCLQVEAAERERENDHYSYLNIAQSFKEEETKAFVANCLL